MQNQWNKTQKISICRIWWNIFVRTPVPLLIECVFQTNIPIPENFPTNSRTHVTSLDIDIDAIKEIVLFRPTNSNPHDFSGWTIAVVTKVYWKHTIVMKE